MSHTKPELRKTLRQARLELTDAEHTLKSRAIVATLKQAIDWSKVKTLHYFEPLRELLEPDISDFITWIEDSYPDIKLFTPRLVGNEWVLVAARGGEVPTEFGVVLVPMLGFDDQLQRIGYGGGYYDKFLATQPHTQKIGVCFELGRVVQIPTAPHDIPLDLIVTETIIYGT
jgi:5-formyltetrahydrofolate cyclo-ligase